MHTLMFSLTLVGALTGLFLQVFAQNDSCAALPSFENGRTTFLDSEGFLLPSNLETYPQDTFAIHRCNPGFRVSGPSSRSCNAIFENDQLVRIDWSPPGEVSCVAVCENLGNLMNGRIEYSRTPDNTARYDVGTVATHICDPGFVLVGNVIRTCRNNSLFDGSPPTCEPIQCEPLPPIENGFIIYAPDNAANYDLGTIATYNCNPNFLLDLSGGGSRTRECVDDGDGDVLGIFDRQAPTCIPMGCEPLPPIENGNINYAPDNVANYDLGTIATYNCNFGFILNLTVGSEMRECIDDGDGDALGIFDGRAPTCVPVCQELGALVNGRIEYSPDMNSPYNEGTVATHICDAGFALVGNIIRTCQNDTFFDGSPPTCQPIECLPLPPIENGFIIYAPDASANYDLGTIATYDCNTGYVLDLSGGGSQTRECVDDGDGDVFGVFNRQAPTCVSIQCEPLPPIENGFIIYGPDTSANYDLGTIATYNCNPNFILDLSGGGSQMRTCVDDGDGDALGIFDRQAPTCVRVCPELGALVNGRTEYFPDMTAPYGVGTMATHICNPGFALVGNVIQICQNDSLFSGTLPTCEPIQCEPLPPIENGFIIYGPDTSASYDLGTIATYNCNSNFILDLSGGGSRTRECIDDGDGDVLGEFNRQAPRCVPILCPELPLISNGIIIYTDTEPPLYNVGSEAIYRCDPGYCTGALTLRECLMDGTWSGSEPVCEVMTCPTLVPPGNGQVTIMDPEQPVGSTATFTCTPPYQIVGPAVITCQPQPQPVNSTVCVNARWPVGPTCQITNIVNDTVTGDPLMTVPLNIEDKSAIITDSGNNVSSGDIVNLCYELHGVRDAYFNLISDSCVSVNAHYDLVLPNDTREDINIVDSVHVRAVDDNSNCQNIEVALTDNGFCTASVGGVTLSTTYVFAGITVRVYPNRVRIGVPNCNDVDLVMWVFCRQNQFWSTYRMDPTTNQELIFTAPMIRFVIARGLNLRETSHGILGQFWNIPIQVRAFSGSIRPGVSAGSMYEITVDHPDSTPRTFVGWLYSLTWEYRSEYCLYAGNQQAGPIFEVVTPNDGVIQGAYTHYMVSSSFNTTFQYSHFNERLCN